VDRARNQFFAGSPFSSNHHGQVGGRRFLDLGMEISHPLTPTNQRPDVMIDHDRFSVPCLENETVSFSRQFPQSASKRK